MTIQNNIFMANVLAANPYLLLNNNTAAQNTMPQNAPLPIVDFQTQCPNTIAQVPDVMPFMPMDPSLYPIMQLMANSPFFTPFVPENVDVNINNVTVSPQKENKTEPETNTNIKPDKNFKNSKKLGKAFLKKVKQVAKNLNCDYRDLLALMNSESGLNPQSKGSIAVGLIQFTNPAIKALNKMYGLNLTKEKILSMSAIEQMDLVEKCLMLSKKMRFAPNARLSAGDLYAITFLPAYAGREVLCSQGDKYYAANKGLDVNKDGKITTSDLGKRLASKRVDESRFEMYA